MAHESAVHAVAFAMFNHYHRYLSPSITDESVMNLWTTNRRKEQWYDRADVAIEAYKREGKRRPREK